MSTYEVAADYSHQAASYDQRWATYVAQSVALTLAQCDVQPGQRLLDVGCGTGTLLQTALKQTPGFQAVGVDVTAAMLAIARQKLPAPVTLQQASAESLPFASNSFDWVVSSSMFHYLSSPRTALSEMRRVLRPGGYLVLTDWDRTAAPMALLDLWLGWCDPAHYRTRTHSEVQNLITETHLDLEATQQASLSWYWHLFSITARKAHI